MRPEIVFGVVTALAQVGTAIKCSEHSILKEYKLDEYSVSDSVSRDTPPSETTEKWWINVCEESKSSAPDECRGGDALCGTTYVSLKGKDPILTQVIDFPADVASRVSTNDRHELVVNLDRTSWGSHSIDAQLTFVCDSGKESNVVKTSSWHDQQIQLTIEGPSGCLKKENEGHDGSDGGDDNHDGDDKRKPVNNKGSSFGSWFVWLVMYALLFSLIYLLATSYMATRGGTFHDFREEFVERSTGLATSLPHFAKEMAGKVMNGCSCNQRGGYSAV